jgi:hypothetical protein
MKTRTISTIVRALATGGFALIVAACVAPVGSDGDPGTKSTEEALPTGCTNDNLYLYCPAAGAFKTTGFEKGLAALHCSGKLVEEGYGPGQDAIYQTRCSLSAQATFACKVHCFWGRDGRQVCSPATVTGGIRELIQCNQGVENLGAVMTSTTACGCSYPAPAGDTYVLWDPTCSSGSCLNRY